MLLTISANTKKMMTNTNLYLTAINEILNIKRLIKGILTTFSRLMINKTLLNAIQTAFLFQLISFHEFQLLN